MKALRVRQLAQQELDRAPAEHREWIEGYTAGYNLYLRETGAAQVKGWCRGQPWVQEIAAADVVAYRRMLGLTAPRFATMIATAQPPASANEIPSATGGGSAAAAAPASRPRTTSSRRRWMRSWRRTAGRSGRSARRAAAAC